MGKSKAGHTVALIVAWIVGLLAAKFVFDGLAQLWRPGQALGFWRFIVLMILAIVVWQIPIVLATQWMDRKPRVTSSRPGSE